MAGFHLIIYGRFWVITEGHGSGASKERGRQGIGPDIAGLSAFLPVVNTTLLGGQSECNKSSGGLGSETLSPLESALLPERLDGVEGGRCLPLKVEAHALFRYAPRRRDPSFSFPEVIRKGMEDGPLRACLRLQGYAAPQLHTHAVIFNVTERDNGQTRALQERSLFQSAVRDQCVSLRTCRKVAEAGI
jgi:hypothetical protein